MKKTISILLVLVMALSLCACLSSCGNNKAQYIGIWLSATPDRWGEDIYMYVYQDGTGDIYTKPFGEYIHGNVFTWEIDGKYFVKTGGAGTFVLKYTLNGENLLDPQGKVAYTKYSSDASVDVPVS